MSEDFLRNEKEVRKKSRETLDCLNEQKEDEEGDKEVKEAWWRSSVRSRD